MAKPAPFDPADPADAIADMLRKQVAEMVAALEPNKQYEELPPDVRVQVLIGGILTALVGVCFAHVEDSAHDAIVEYIADCLPAARQQAEGIMANQPH